MSEIPKDYFKELPDLINDRISNLDDEGLKGDAPLLFSIRKDFYKTPDNYFKTSYLRLIEGKGKSRTLSFRSLIMAASFIGILTFMWVFVLQNPDDESNYFVDVDAIDYVIENPEDIDEMLLTEFLSDSQDLISLSEQSDDEILFDIILNDLTDLEIDNLN